jgi:CRP-like cAMP-binding protein
MSSNSDQDKIIEQCEFQDNLSILRQITFFSGLPIELLKVFAYLCIREELKSGHYIFSQDDDDGCGYFIISGQTELVRKENDTEHVVKTFEEGVFIGVLSLLGTMPRLFSLKAKDSVTCLVITREKFTKAVERFPEMMPKLIQMIVNRIALWDKQAIHAWAGQWKEYNENIGISVI